MVGLFFFLLAAIIGRRAGCHLICRIAPCMILGRQLAKILKIPSLGIASVAASCCHCGRCSKACPMSITVEKQVANGMITDADCILCGSCIASCPAATLRFHWGAVNVATMLQKSIDQSGS